MSNYIFEFQGERFTPDGRVNFAAENTELHNKTVERVELNVWAERPDHAIGYVKLTRVGEPLTIGRLLTVSTWMGTPIADGYITSVYRNPLTDSRMVTVRVRGTNGAEYFGRLGWDWTEAVRLHKAKEHSK